MADYQTETRSGGTWLLVGGGAILLVVLLAIFTGGNRTSGLDSAAVPELDAAPAVAAPALPAEAQ